MSVDRERIYAQFNRVMTPDEIASGVAQEREIWELWGESPLSNDITALEIMSGAIANIQRCLSDMRTLDYTVFDERTDRLILRAEVIKAALQLMGALDFTLAHLEQVPEATAVAE